MQFPLRLRQVNYLFALTAILYVSVECALVQPEPTPKLRLQYVDGKENKFFLPDVAQSPLGMVNSIPALFIILNNTGTVKIPAGALKLYLLDEKRTNLTGLQSIATQNTLEILPGKILNISDFSKTLLPTSSVPKECKPKFVVVTFTSSTTQSKERVLYIKLVHIGGNCKPPADNVKVDAVVGSAVIASDSMGEYIDLSKLLTKLSISMEKGGVLNKRGLFKYGFAAFLRKLTDKSEMYHGKHCQGSPLFGPPNMQLGDVILEDLSIDDLKTKIDKTLSGKLYLTGTKAQVCPGSICGKVQIIFMFDPLHEMAPYKEFDKDKCDSIVVREMTIDCSKIKDKLEAVNLVNVMPDLFRKGMSSYALSCNGMNQPRLSRYNSHENTWSQPCIHKFDKSLLQRLARMKFMAQAKLKELLSKDATVRTKICEDALKAGRKRGSKNLQPLTSACITAFKQLWANYYTEDMSKIKKDPKKFRTDLKALLTPCADQEVVVPWIKTVDKMFNSTGGFNESNIDKNNMGSSKDCPRGDLRKIDLDHVSEDHMLLSKLARLYNASKKVISTACESNPFEKDIMQCVYQLLADKISKPTEKIIDNDMKDEMKNKSKMLLKQKLTEAMKKDGKKEEEAKKDVEMRLKHCEYDDDPRPVEMSPTFFKVENGKIMKATFNPFLAETKPYCWRPIARSRCPDCEKRMYGTALDRSSKYTCD